MYDWHWYRNGEKKAPLLRIQLRFKCNFLIIDIVVALNSFSSWDCYWYWIWWNDGECTENCEILYFNPYINICCSYLAKILRNMWHIFSILLKIVDCMEPWLLIHQDWHKGEVSILVNQRLKMVLNLECSSYWYSSW